MDAQVISGAALRDAGIAATLAAEQAEWRDRYRQAAWRWIRNRFAIYGANFGFSSEDIRHHAETLHIGEPHHPNVWSAAFSSFLRELRQEFCVSFEASERSWRSSAHSRRLPRYRVEGRL